MNSLELREVHNLYRECESLIDVTNSYKHSDEYDGNVSFYRNNLEADLELFSDTFMSIKSDLVNLKQALQAKEDTLVAIRYNNRNPYYQSDFI